MRVNVVNGMAEAIRKWAADLIIKSQPRLNCEVDKMGLDEALDLLTAIVKSWDSDVLLIRTIDANVPRLVLIDFPELRNVAEQYFGREGTISVMDIENVGGCTFDVDENEGNDDTYCFLATGWGEHEKTVLLASELRGDAHIFRGN
jgi:hypothetical protein